MSFSWNGLDRLREQLSAMPSALADEAVPIIRTAAEQAAEKIKQTYPVVEGNLRRGVKVRGLRREGAAVSIAVVSTAPHAHLYEYGTAKRTTKRGANRGPDSRVARPVVSVVAPRVRRTMDQELIDMLERKAQEAVS